MILPKRSFALLTLVLSGFATAALAQIGDNADKVPTGPFKNLTRSVPML